MPSPGSAMPKPRPRPRRPRHREGVHPRWFVLERVRAEHAPQSCGTHCSGDHTGIVFLDVADLAAAMAPAEVTA